MSGASASLHTQDSGLEAPFLNTFEKRLSTFADWPAHRLTKAVYLAAAGFLQTSASEILCFICDLELDTTQNVRIEDPLAFHVRNRPSCIYVISLSMTTFEKRLETFKHWPRRGSTPPSHVMAAAGFFHVTEVWAEDIEDEYGDLAACFSCHMYNGGWHKDEIDPTANHDRECPWRKKIVGLENGAIETQLVEEASRMNAREDGENGGSMAEDIFKFEP